MTAGIDFDIYHNFDQYAQPNGDYLYENALVKLNEMLENLVKRNKLTILYKHRRVKIKLPLTLNDCGNIFSEKYDKVDKWNGVSIRCEIDCEYCDFEWDKLDVGVCPDNFIATGTFV